MKSSSPTTIPPTARRIWWKRLPTIPGLIRLIRCPQNRGKGAAMRAALEHANGDYCLIQDADWSTIRRTTRALGTLMDGSADVVYGSRFLSSGRRRVLYYWHSVANHRAHHPLQHHFQPQPDGYGDLLQGVSHSVIEEHSHCAAIVSGLSRRSRLRSPSARPGSMRCPSATTAAPMRKARRSG